MILQRCQDSALGPPTFRPVPAAEVVQSSHGSRWSGVFVPGTQAFGGYPSQAPPLPSRSLQSLSELTANEVTVASLRMWV